MAEPPKTEPSLQIIAATSVAVSLWNHLDGIPNAVWERSKCINDVLNLYSNALKSAEKISLPKSVHELIRKYVRNVHEEIVKWVRYHLKSIYFNAEGQGYRLISNLSCFVWYHDCTINYKQTARNLQNSVAVHEIDKFRFLCLYCLKDEIEQKWKFLVQNEAIGSIIFDNRYPLIHYWRYYCLNRLQDVPVTEGMSLDEFMFRHENVDNWPAMEYFFDRMNVDEQIQNTIWIIDQQSKSKYQKLVIMKLNQSQRYAIYESRSVEILLNYATKSACCDEIFPQWLEMAGFFNEEDFVKLLRGLFMRKVLDSIIAQILISASDELKLRVLNYKNDEFVEQVWNLWTRFYDDSFKMVLDMSSSIRTEIVKTKMFRDHCESLLNGKFLMLERVLRFCFPKDEELVSIKRQLSELGFFTESLLNYMKHNELAALKQTLNFFLDVIDLNKFKEDFVNQESFKDYCRDLIEDGRILDLDKLLTFFSKPEKTRKSWRDFFGKTFFASCTENLIFSDKVSVLDEFLNCFHFTTEESTHFKRDLRTKKMFSDSCQKLIKQNELSKLEEILKSLFPCVDELVRFKQVLSGKKVVNDHYQELIETDRLTEFNELSSFLFLDVEELREFKRNFTTKKFFDDRCVYLSRLSNFAMLELLLESFFPDADQLVEFKRRLTRKKIFLDHCQTLITSYHDLEDLKNLWSSCLFSSAEDVAQFKQNYAKKKLIDDCEKLIACNRLPRLNDLLKLFFPSVKETTTFKKILVEKNSFNCHCETLIDSGSFSNLNELLNWSFPKKRDLNQFMNYIADSNYIKEKCINLYAAEKVVELNNFLSSLFLLQSELVYKVKRNLLLSEEGFEMSLKLMEKSSTVLDDIMLNCLPTAISLVDFKKEIIFSPGAISHLSRLMLKNVLIDVKNCFHRFLNSAADRKMLKMQLLDNAVEFFAMIFFKLDKSACQSTIKWWLPDKISTEECKQKLSVDAVFDAGIKTCIFETFDPYGRISRCTFKKDFNFEALDRFLKWYFESSKEVKDFKIKKIRNYQNMETISVLLKNGCRYLYFKQVLDWFFENDAVEMAKFKKKHRGEKIASMINFVDESYSKRKRTL